MERIPRRSLTTEFKEEAVKLVLEQKLTQAEVAKRLDISVKSLNNRVAQHRKGSLKGVTKSAHLLRCLFLTCQQQACKEAPCI